MCRSTPNGSVWTGGSHGGDAVVVGHPLRHREFGRPIVEVVLPIAGREVDVASRPGDEGEIDRRRPRLTVHRGARERRRRQRRIDRLRHDRIAGVGEPADRHERARAGAMRQLHGHETVDAVVRVGRRERQASPRRRRRAVNRAERIVEDDRRDVVVEKRAGVRGAQQQRVADELGARVCLRQPVVGRGGKLDQAAVAEGSAKRDRAFAVGAANLRGDGQRAAGEVLEAAFSNQPARTGLELRAELVEDGRDGRRIRLYARLKGIVDLEHARPDAGEERPGRAAQQHRDLIPQEPGLELAGPVDVDQVTLIAAADVIGGEVQEPSVLLPIQAQALDEQAVAQIAIALVPCGVAVGAGAANAEVNRAGPPGRRRRAAPMRAARGRSGGPAQARLSTEHWKFA